MKKKPPGKKIARTLENTAKDREAMDCSLGRAEKLFNTYSEF